VKEAVILPQDERFENSLARIVIFVRIS